MPQQSAAEDQRIAAATQRQARIRNDVRTTNGSALESASTPVIRRIELVLVLATLVAAFALCDRFGAYDQLARFARRHMGYPVDELVLATLLSGWALLYVTSRRTTDMRREIARRKSAEARALALARHDPLTGLPNRRALADALALSFEQGSAAIFLIDLDHFKPVNDINGHETGDQLLISVAERLSRSAGDGALLARLGGDEFACVVQGTIESDQLSRLAREMIASLSEVFVIGERHLTIGATIGVARLPLDGDRPEDILRAADLAMYEAKRSGRGTFCFFHPKMDARLRERALLEQDVRNALTNGEIVAFFQPVVGLADGQVHGFEALARWHHPTQGLLLPEIFVPVVEDLNLAQDLMTLVLREGARAARNWPAHVSLSINISPRQLRDPWLGPRIVSLLTECGLAPSRLIVEVTENAIIEDIDQAAATFESLKSAGVRVSLDDFGKGYSSLAHLRQLRFNQLKIDGSFVRTMYSPESREIIVAVASLGKALDMPVTAEGVETREEADLLRALGCDRAQGYFFGRPAAAPSTDAATAADTARTSTALADGRQRKVGR